MHSLSQTLTLLLTHTHTHEHTHTHTYTLDPSFFFLEFEVLVTTVSVYFSRIEAGVLLLYLISIGPIRAADTRCPPSSHAHANTHKHTYSHTHMHTHAHAGLKTHPTHNSYDVYRFFTKMKKNICFKIFKRWQNTRLKIFLIQIFNLFNILIS